MSSGKTGHSLVLYLENLPTLSALEAADTWPQELQADEELIIGFRERASSQAVALLEAAHAQLNKGGSVPYRTERRSQRRTVQDQWWMTGRLFRPRERNARAYWSLGVDTLRGQGPCLVYMVGPSDPGAGQFELLTVKAAQHHGLESANTRNCFSTESGYDLGVVAGFAKLSPELTHVEAVKALETSISGFLAKFRQEFEASLDQ